MSLNEFRSLLEQEHRFRVDALGGQELVRRLADPLRQHHELAERRDLDRVDVALQLQRQDRLGRLEQVERLPVDRAQRLADLGQRLLLARRRCRRSSRRGRPAAATASSDVLHADGAAATRPRRSSGCARCVASTSALSFTSGNAGGAADQRLRDRLGEPLRLHQRLAAGARPAPSRGRPTRTRRSSGAIRPIRPRPSSAEQDPLLLGDRPLADQRQAAPSGAAPVSAPCRRVSVKSAISDGTASEMIDDAAGAIAGVRDRRRTRRRRCRRRQAAGRRRHRAAEPPPRRGQGDRRRRRRRRAARESASRSSGPNP